MRILITGIKGFLGANMKVFLESREYLVDGFDTDTPRDLLSLYVQRADFIFHFAGVNRSQSINDFIIGNVDLTSEIILELKKAKKMVPLIFTSSIQATLDNDYGKSKRMAEESLLDFHKETGNPVFIYRLTNLFGKWSRPNYNSVVATFCFNASRAKPLIVNDFNAEISLLYIDDVAREFIDVIEGKRKINAINVNLIEPVYSVKVGDLATTISGFYETAKGHSLPNLANDFIKKLYATYLSFLEPSDFSYSLNMNVDLRGSFTEFLRTNDSGQISVNVTHPGISKGNHFHHTKNEKFLVVSGYADIKLRKIGTEEVLLHSVSGEKFVVVNIPPGFTHSITNTGESDLITIMWASEPYDKNNPDTFFQMV